MSTSNRPALDRRSVRPKSNKKKPEVESKPTTIKQYEKPVIFQKLHKSLLLKIFDYLKIEELSRLNLTCRRFRNAVQSYVTDLQVMVNWGEEDDYIHHGNDFEMKNHVFLEHCSPKDFFSPNPPFQYIKHLYLCYDDQQTEKVLLSKLVQLKYLKIRGAHIQLSSNKLPTVTHIDIDDPNVCEKQVFRNLKNFHLEVNTEDFSQLHNTTQNEAIKFIFIKSLDILLHKNDLEQVSFTIILPQMNLLLFEQFNDSLTDYLKNHEEEIRRGVVSCVLKHEVDYEINGKDQRRWDKAWENLLEILPDDYPDFDIKVEEWTPDYGIPVI